MYELNVELCPTCIVMPKGSRLALNVAGRDFARGATGPDDLKMKGSGPFVHTDPEDRAREVYGGTTTLHSGRNGRSYLLLPVIPG